EAGEGPPRHAAEWRSEALLSSGASRRPFDPSFAKATEGPLPHYRGEERLSLGEPGQDKYRTVKRARQLRTSMTDAEMILWSRLRRRQIDGFKIRRQHPIGPYIADFACAEAKLVIEVDGEAHGSPQELAHDRRRTRFMESRGWRVIRCYNVEVYSNLDGVLIQIAEALAARTSSPRKRGRKPS
ncbi:MAG: endonuclease domain-containing protein, partial [Pseudomonadota bacterium]|nr:endonuclease domain-containing protein [Pseudomonadota bacterium]